MKPTLILLAVAMLMSIPVLAGGIPHDVAARTERATTVAAAGNEFSMDLYARLAPEKGNLFFSPHSIHAALSMTRAGARGQTAEEMTKLLHLDLDLAPEKQHLAYSSLLTILNAPPARGGEAPYQLVVANALWAQQGFPFHKEYQELVKTHYQAGLENVDYISATEAARTTINQWVEKQTKEKIKDLLAPGILNRDTRLVLTNAIYFKAAWASQFQKDSTADADFHLPGGTAAKVPMMHHEARFPYGEDAATQILQLPYVGHDLSMVILLPRKKDGLGDLEKNLTAANIQKWIKDVKPRQVDVFLPRFKITSQFGLADTLKAMGMPTAFTDNADFSAMATAEKLVIQDVIHKAFVDVDEEGTEAAAATAVVVGITAAPMPQEPVAFRADHPFILLIRHQPTGAILFMGRVVNPKE